MNGAALTGSKRPVDQEGDPFAGDLIQGVASVGPANGESVVAGSPSEAQILSQRKAYGLIVDLQWGRKVGDVFLKRND